MIDQSDLKVRADGRSVCADAELLANAEFAHRLTEIVPCVVLILNRQRQVVFCNQRLLTLIDAAAAADILGKRPGELFDCVHATHDPAGCGTSSFCQECGALKTLVALPTPQTAAVNECRILTKLGRAYEFHVQATPYRYADKDFTIFSLSDISDKKRREALERTFFHDVNNHLSVVMGYAEVLSEVKSPELKEEYCKIIQIAGQELSEEIAAHKRLLQAENGELPVNIVLVESLTILGDVMKIFCENDRWKDRKMIAALDSELVALLTDRTLLLRVLGNMLKNALEATSTGDEVHLACRQQQDRVVFSVHNPGCIPPAVQRQLFQRSFSTKGNGRGIGTYSMKLFGEQYLHGDVRFVSTEEQGTTFEFALPLEHPRVGK